MGRCLNVWAVYDVLLLIFNTLITIKNNIVKLLQKNKVKSTKK